MGALHAGHLTLLHRAAELADLVVCSVFVNPLQFDDKDDLANYPRQLEQDAELLGQAGCRALFAPAADDLYAGFFPRRYDLGGLDEVFEGASRPGHFQGVVNVVERLFHAVRPDLACFGEKDRQQLAVLQHVARHLHWPEVLVPCPIVREPDGLAMSSRNQRLGAQDRERATALYRALEAAAELAFRASVSETEKAARAVLESTPGVEPDYFAIADPRSLRPLSDWDGVEEAVALVAAQVGPVRLIDNRTLRR